MQELSILHGEPPYKDVLINILGCVEEFCFETYVITVNVLSRLLYAWKKRTET